MTDKFYFDYTNSVVLVVSKFRTAYQLENQCIYCICKYQHDEFWQYFYSLNIKTTSIYASYFQKMGLSSTNFILVNNVKDLIDIERIKKLPLPASEPQYLYFNSFINIAGFPDSYKRYIHKNF